MASGAHPMASGAHPMASGVHPMASLTIPGPLTTGSPAMGPLTVLDLLTILGLLASLCPSAMGPLAQFRGVHH